MFASKSSLVLAALFVSVLAIPTPDAGSKSFTKQNGEDAIAQAEQFKSLTADSACTSGADACIGDQFAQCANGKFVLTGCAAGTTCAVLPLVNKPGTAVTCTTEADRDARIAATGATQKRSSKPVEKRAASKAVQKLNGQDAQNLNKKFQGLNVNSKCQAGENACVNNQFAQCVNGKFVLSPCGATLQCVALPLVNSRGTSITCDIKADAIARMGLAGAGNSLT